MATRYGYAVFRWLIERGWKEAPLEEKVCGDQGVLDPQTNKEYTVYEAAKIQKERTGEYPDFLKEG